VHTSFLQDPKIAAMMGQNPQAQALMAAAQAHIMEHVAFQYRRDIEKQLGAALPPMPTEDGENTLPAQIEVELSQLAAQAAAKLLQKDVAEAQAQQAAQQMQDPLVQMQQMDLQIKQMQAQTKQMQVQMEAQAKQEELRLKEQQLYANAAAKEDELRLREAEISGRQQLEAARLGADIEKHKAQEANRQELEGTRIGVDIAKSKQMANMQRMSQLIQSQKGSKPKGG
jgi:hypothetical protein